MKEQKEKSLNDYKKETLIAFIIENLHFGKSQAFERLDKIEKNLKLEHLLSENQKICDELPKYSDFQHRHKAQELRNKFDKNQIQINKLLGVS